MTKEQKQMCFDLRKITTLGLLACKFCLKTYNWNFEEAKLHYLDFLWNKKLIEININRGCPAMAP